MSIVYCVYELLVSENDLNEFNIVGAYKDRSEAVKAAVDSTENNKEYFIEETSSENSSESSEDEISGEEPEGATDENSDQSEENSWPDDMKAYFTENNILDVSGGNQIRLVVGIQEKVIGETSIGETLI